MVDKFECSVFEAKEKYRKEKYSEPKYLIINGNTFNFIKHDIKKRKLFGLLDKKIYKGLYIAIDNELEDYQFVITG